MSWFDNLIQRAINDPYLNELMVKAEISYSIAFLHMTQSNTTLLTEQDFFDLLRFSDILCRSRTAEGRNKAYKIISLLYDQYKDNPFFQQCANTVLTKLGIFPTLSLISTTTKISSNIEITLEKSIKEIYQRAPSMGKVFTDSQYALFEKLKNSNHYSFSGPTSFGKSFVIDSFINYLITERNASDNIVVLVPTRALINQVSQKLKQEITNEKYKILTHPVIPNLFLQKNFKYIFVFTPERWISYVADNNNPKVTYMFIDEAQKVISQKDSRSPLYYHAILLAERKSINLYFASPNIPNAQVFLELFEKSQDEVMVIEDSPVAQNRYYFDFIEHKAVMFSDSGNEISLEYDTTKEDYFHLLIKLGKGCQNIVYCNTIEDTTNIALEFSKKQPVKNSDKINDLITLIKSFIHKDYFLIDCLQHGIAFHFGRLPQRIRERVEQLFSQGEIDYVFCTSTLLEGVNLPAKNIFILNNAIGMTKFSHIDFWNLAGRAGRLSKELSGNIICVRAYNKRNRWDTPSTDLDVVRDKKIPKVSPIIISGAKNFYKNVGNAIQEVPFTRKDASQTDIDIWNHYSNILCIHQIGKNDSILMNNFLKKNPVAPQVLQTVSKLNHVPLSILEQSSTIKVKYQNTLWDSAQLEQLPSDISLDSCRKILNILYDTYNWIEEEAGGRNPMVRDRARLQYFSILMFSWIQGTPLNMIINNLINYYRKKGTIFYQGNYIKFNPTDKGHINLVINELMSDIDTALRFKIKNYLLNYGLICSAKFSDDTSLKWTDFLEYGTTDPIVIELQTIGLPRHLATLIIEEYPECLEIENMNIINMNIQMMKSVIDQNKYYEEYKELETLLDW